MPVIIKDGLFTVGVFVRMHYFLIGRIYMLDLKRSYYPKPQLKGYYMVATFFSLSNVTQLLILLTSYTAMLYSQVLLS